MDASSMMVVGLATAFSSDPFARAALFLSAGTALGAANFGALAWNAGLYLSGGVGRAVAIQLGRFALLVAILSGIAQLGAQPLLWAVLGVFFGRMAVVRRFGSSP
jgi:hypothetical protein